MPDLSTDHQPDPPPEVIAEQQAAAERAAAVEAALRPELERLAAEADRLRAEQDAREAATVPSTAPQPATPAMDLREKIGYLVFRAAELMQVEPMRPTALEAADEIMQLVRAEPDAAPAAPEHEPGESASTDNTYTADEGAEILADVKAHPKRDLIEAIADATFDVVNEDGTGAGGGMWHHLAQAHGLVEALPALCLDEDSLCDEPGCGAHSSERVAMVKADGPLSTVPPAGTEGDR